jgi:hypothetical protein
VEEAMTVMEALRRAEERIMQQPVEHMVVVSRDGVERGEVVGNATQVNLTGHLNENMIEAYRPIATHNHPGKYPLVLLSSPDVTTSFMLGFSEMRAVNQYGLVYSVVFPPLPRDMRRRIAIIQRLITKGSSALSTILLPVSLFCSIFGLCGGCCLLPLGAAALAAFAVSNMRPVWLLYALLAWHKLPTNRWGYTRAGEQLQ